jgi:hypothetical protein
MDIIKDMIGKNDIGKELIDGWLHDIKQQLLDEKKAIEEDQNTKKITKKWKMLLLNIKKSISEKTLGITFEQWEREAKTSKKDNETDETTETKDDPIDETTETKEVAKAKPEEIDSFYNWLLEKLGAPKTEWNITFLKARRQSEWWKARNNPFNTTLTKEWTTNYNPQGVKNYISLEDGIDAIYTTLTKTGNWEYYKDIVTALQKWIKTKEEAKELAIERQKKWWPLWIRVNGPASNKWDMPQYIAAVLNNTTIDGWFYV